jgi:hypothetical protein
LADRGENVDGLPGLLKQAAKKAAKEANEKQ